MNCPHDEDLGEVCGNGRLVLRTSKLFKWMLGTAEGWCPLEQVNRETLEFVRDYISTALNWKHYPPELRTYVSVLLATRLKDRNDFMPLLAKHPGRDKTRLRIEEKNNNISPK